MSSFVISLDFELFWGVSDSRRINDYRQNVEGVWIAIPKMLALFRQYGIHATWATVGMLMCRNHAQWSEIRPTLMPGYLRQGCSNYSLDTLAHENSSLFFARPLVEQILETPGQELATHTYSHFYCGEEGASPAQFAADLECAKAVAGDLGVVFKSLVFPRNQVLAQYLPMASAAGLQVYRGNFDHWLYREGHTVPGGVAGRAIRYADSWLPLSGTHAQEVSNEHGIANVPASLFLRPWSRSTVALEPLRLARLKAAMTDAAKQDKVCHLWWHPHNFAFTKYGNFNFAYDIGNWNVSLGYPSWFFIAPLLGPAYILYTLMLGFISFYLLKKIGISSLSIDMLWYAWLVYLMAPWLLTFTGFIYALLVFFALKVMLSLMPTFRMFPSRATKTE